MNRLQATIQSVEAEGPLALVDVATPSGHSLSALLLDFGGDPSRLAVGARVTVAFKETEVSVATGSVEGLSLRNRLPGRIVSVETGRLLCTLTLDCGGERIVSVITLRSAKRLGLRVGDEVTGLVKANEVSLLWSS